MPIEPLLQRALERLQKEVPLKVIMSEDKNEECPYWGLESQSVAGRKYHALWIYTGDETGVQVSGKLKTDVMFETITTICATNKFIRRS